MTDRSIKSSLLPYNNNYNCKKFYSSDPLLKCIFTVFAFEGRFNTNSLMDLFFPLSNFLAMNEDAVICQASLLLHGYFGTTSKM
jgi:hypothetical protein